MNRVSRRTLLKGAAWLGVGTLLPPYGADNRATGKVRTNASNLSVRDFGARGDGVADDTAAFRSAISRTGYVPAGVYCLNPDGVDLPRLHGEGILKLTTGATIGLQGPADVGELSLIYWKELEPAPGRGLRHNAVAQAIGSSENRLFITQNVSMPDGVGAYSSVVRVSEYPLARFDHADFDISNNKGAEKAIATVDLLGCGHGNGCTALKVNGKSYLYTAASLPKSVAIKNKSQAYGTGFSRIEWRGSSTTQADVKSFHNVRNVQSAEVCVSSDGRYIAFLGRYRVTGQPRKCLVTLYLRDVLESAVDVAAVAPEREWEVRDKKAGISYPPSGVFCDGRYVYTLYSSAKNTGARIIIIYSMSGELIRRISFMGIADISDWVLRETQAGYASLGYEIEGLALVGNVLLVCNKVIAALYGSIVSWKGKNFICLKDGSGKKPSDRNYWAETEVAANAGGYDPAVKYTGAGKRVYHKYIIGIVGSEIDPRGHAISFKKTSS